MRGRGQARRGRPRGRLAARASARPVSFREHVEDRRLRDAREVHRRPVVRKGEELVPAGIAVDRRDREVAAVQGAFGQETHQGDDVAHPCAEDARGGFAEDDSIPVRGPGAAPATSVPRLKRSLGASAATDPRPAGGAKYMRSAG